MQCNTFVIQAYIQSPLLCAHEMYWTCTADGCKRPVRERLLTDMLNTVSDPVGAGWKVLIMDEFTTKIMSSVLKMSDILDTGR